MRKSRTSRHRTLQYEALERREVMAAGITASLGSALSLGSAGAQRPQTTSQQPVLHVAPGTQDLSSSLWSNSTIPATVDAGDGAAVTLGVKFTATTNGSITGIKFYKSATNTGVHTASLWSSSGQLLATGTFVNETASGWQTVSFSSPVAITAGTTYVASYFAPRGHYSVNRSAFATGLSSGNLRVRANGGVFMYGSSSAFPTQSYQASNYWVDVVFSTTPPVDNSPPTVTSTSPANGATSVATANVITIGFSEALDASTVTSSTVRLLDGATPVSASVAYNATNNTVTITPAAALGNSKTYTISISGGAAGVKDLAGNALTQSFGSSFTTSAASTAQPGGLWSSSTTPATIDAGDGGAVNLGVKFTADTSGFITGIRFYKSAANTGTHIGQLWSSSGQLLATATFTNETASGWQTVTFSNSVAITAGTTYIASYLAPKGHFSVNLKGFSTPFTSNHLAVPVNGGVFKYGTSPAFPTQTNQASNYWVDVVLSATPPAPPSSGTVSGTVWDDRNGNGARDAGDVGLAGRHILINGVDRATTDANGYWSVSNLAAGNYTIQEASQSGWAQTYGATGHALGVAAGANLPYLDFGDFKTVTLGGTVWNDHNNNNARDVGDEGLAGWHILINGVDRAITDSNGHWSVANLAAGNYTIQEVSQSGWTKTLGTSGYTSTAVSGGDLPNLDFGDFKTVTLSGSVWEDHNNNGSRDAGDQGLAGWHILINGVDRATTDANGYWSVSNLGAGTYTLQEAPQSGYTRTYGSLGHVVGVTSGVDLLYLDFGNYKTPAPPAATWFDTNVQDAALRSLGNSLYTDSLLDRSDMLALFQRTENDGTVSSTELGDLQRIVANTSLFGNLSYVDKLASYVVNGNSANAMYQGQLMGNLSASATATQLANLVNKWFLGLDRPTTPYGYSLASGSLFVGGVAYTDIDQGNLSDCGFMSALAETAMHTPSTITNMFVVNGDGTYTVRFYHSGIAEYVTVDSYLPTSGGNFVYGLGNKSASNSANELWTALAEKAFAQIGEMSYFARQNSYGSIEYLFAYSTLAQITGQSTVGLTVTAGSGSLPSFAAAYNAGNMIVMCSYVNAPNVVSDHCYAVVSYDAANQTVTLYNPWGINYGLTTLTWTQVQANFYYFDRTT